MKLEDQVVSLELAKKLKELGVKQNSIHYWGDVNYSEGKKYREIHGEKWEVVLHPTWKNYPAISCGWTKEYMISAFTVAELGEMLPVAYYSGRMPNEKWNCFDYVNGSETLSEETEADARAKMLIHLIENRIVKP